MPHRICTPRNLDRHRSARATYTFAKCMAKELLDISECLYLLINVHWNADEKEIEPTSLDDWNMSSQTSLRCPGKKHVLAIKLSLCVGSDAQASNVRKRPWTRTLTLSDFTFWLQQARHGTTERHTASCASSCASSVLPPWVAFATMFQVSILVFHRGHFLLLGRSSVCHFPPSHLKVLRRHRATVKNVRRPKNKLEGNGKAQTRFLSMRLGICHTRSC